MKRLLSWLLVLVMVIGLLPMSAFAATDVDWEVNDEDMDIIVDFGGELNPIDLTEDLSADKTATVTVPAGKIYYFIAYNVRNGMEMTITGLDPVICSVAPGAAYTWSIDNSNGEADAEYVITISFPEGHMENPKVIEEMSWYSDEVTQAAGDNDGFFYTYTAVADGVVTLYFYPEYDDEGNVIEGSERDIMVTNTNTGAQYSLLIDGVDNYGKELQIPVAAGDVLSINTAYVADAAGNAYPAATYSWTGNFAYPAGSEQNPIVIEWVWDEAYANATASVTTEADGTYYVGYAGMILTVDGNVVEMDEAGNFVLSAGEHNLALATPVGAQANPEVIENIDGYSDTNSLAADGAYYYIWTATEDGTVTLDVTSGANLTVDKLTYSEDSEWPISTQYVLAEPEIDENWNYTGWTVAENLVIDVVAGEQLKIQVNALTDWSTWTTPAIDYTLTGEFEAAVTGPVYDERLTFSSTALSLKSGIIGQFIMTDPVATYGYDSVKIVVEKAGETVEVTDYEVSGSRIAFYVGFTAKMMTEKATVTIYAEKDGVTYVGEPLVDWSIKSKGIEMLDKYYANYGTSRKTICDLVANMLNYGAAAQTHFDYNTDDLATDGLKDEYLALIIDQDPSLTSITYPANPTDAVFKRNNTALSLGANIQLQMRYAKPSGDLSAYHAVIENKDRGTKYEDIPGSEFAVSGNNVYVLFDGVTAQQLRETLVITIYEGETPVSASFELSIENVAAGMLSKYPTLIPAMINYSDCAKAHFGS